MIALSAEGQQVAGEGEGGGFEGEFDRSPVRAKHERRGRSAASLLYLYLNTSNLVFDN